MANNKKQHPIGKLINLTVLLVALIWLAFSTANFFARGWCANAHGVSFGENPDWRVDICINYYWEKELRDINGW